MKLSPQEVGAIVADLGIPDLDAFFARLRTSPFPEAKALLERAQGDMAKAWRRKARELHPDLNGGNPEKTEAFKRYAVVVEDFKRIQVTPPAPPPSFRRIVIFGTGSGTSTTATWSTNGTGSWRTG